MKVKADFIFAFTKLRFCCMIPLNMSSNSPQSNQSGNPTNRDDESEKIISQIPQKKSLNNSQIPEYNHAQIEKKWQKTWEKLGIYKTSTEVPEKYVAKDSSATENSPASANSTTSTQSAKPKAYILDMFPYPSGTGLHVGHQKGYIATDIYSRFKKMNGFDILHPMGWDAFGLPAEEFAIKNKIHPSIAVKQNIATYKEQLSILGFNYDWSREVNTTDPEYYKWTQWVFIQMHKKGLTFESHEPINWCPSCKTGLANEDLEDGRCERCGSIVEKKPLRQWVIRITDYADRLLNDLNDLNWPESIKESQRNWIGRSEGSEIDFALSIDANITIDATEDVNIDDMGAVKVFTTRPDTLYGATYIVLAPEHPIIPLLQKNINNWDDVQSYLISTKNKTIIERTAEGKEKSGVHMKGIYAIHPITGDKVSVWIADYVLGDYGTGAVMAVPAHDERDAQFAHKYSLPSKRVIDEEVNRIIDSEEFTGEEPESIRTKITEKAKGKMVTKYKLRDWVFSRQRYWGEPIPLIHCENCGVVPVPEDELPLKLPDVEFYEPTGTGESPLAAIDSWVNVKCPVCKGKAKRETNTMPQWAGSCWYYLRYIDPKNKKQLIDPAKEKYWQPVDMYVGGAEHATRHLIYARFWHKFLFDIGVVTTSEPFMQLKNQGLITGPDGRKMSKRFGNVINPNDMVDTYGADTLRVYEMFMGPFGQTIAWSTDNMIGSRRFIERVWRLVGKVHREEVMSKIAAKSVASITENIVNNAENATHAYNHSQSYSHSHTDSKEILTILHKTIKKVGEDIEAFNFNTAISSMMILLNALEKEEKISVDTYEIFLKILAPFAPHVTDELFATVNKQIKFSSISVKDFAKKIAGKVIGTVGAVPTDSIHSQNWPKYNPRLLISDEVTIMIQVNGKTRGSIKLSAQDAENEAFVTEKATALDEIKKWTGDNLPDRKIFVSGKLINLVFKSLNQV